VPLDFPTSPATGDRYDRYHWSGIAWDCDPPRIVTVTSINPTSAVQNASVFTEIVRGQHFKPTSKVVYDGQEVTTTYIHSNELQFQLTPPTAASGKTSGTINVSDATSANFVITFAAPPPLPITVSGVSPLAGVQNEAVTLTVTGTNFLSGTQITINGLPVATTFVSASQLTTSYTSPYFNPTELGSLNITVNVVGSTSSAITVNFVDPRFKIRSTYPDYYSEWTPNVNHIEVWGWGIMAADSVVYIDRMGGAGPEPRSTWIDPNIVGSELILVFDINPAPEYDAMTKLTVLNKGKHWSAGSWDFWVEDIG
jgi:hypothetical protein